MARELHLHRRPILYGLGLAPLLTCAPGPSPRAEPRRSFYVAGVRFNPTASRFHVGQAVAIDAGEFEGETTLQVLAGAPLERLGFVPKAMTPSLAGEAPCFGVLKAVAMGGVPWRRFLVEL